LLTAIELTPGGSSTVHIYTQTVHRTTQLIWEEFGPCPVFANYTLAFALQLRKKRGKNLSDVDVPDKGLVEQEMSCSSYMTSTVLPLFRIYKRAKSAFV